MVYSISYDLHEPGQKYKKLHQLIKDISNDRWANILESTYIIKSFMSPEQIYKHLSSALDKNDCIFISEITSNYSGVLGEDMCPYIKNLF